MKTKLLLAAACLALCGCNTTRYSFTRVEAGATNRVEIVNVRAIWSTEGYTVRLAKDGTGTLTAQRSRPDAEFVRAVTEMLVSLGVKAAAP